MNSPITFPPPAPALKLARPSAEKWAATLAEERRRLLEDQEALRERETNLREYEARLRGLQAEIEAGRALHRTPSHHAADCATGVPASGAMPQRPSSLAPVEDHSALQLAWEKLHRARELLEAEQTHLRDDRFTIREQEAALARREQAVALREAQVAEREALLAAATPPAAQHVSAVSKLTRAPFNMARSVFGGQK